MKPSDLLAPLFCGLLFGCAAPDTSDPVRASASARAIGSDDAFWDNLWGDVDGIESDPTLQRQVTEAPLLGSDPYGVAVAPVDAGDGVGVEARATPMSTPAGINGVEIAPGVLLPSRHSDALNALQSTGYEILSAEQGVGITAEKVEQLKGAAAVSYLLGKGEQRADPAVSGRPAESREVTITTRRAFQFPGGVFNGGHRFESRYEWR